MNYNSFQENFSKYILSASGFRKIFSPDNNEESSLTNITTEDSAAAALIADVFSSMVSSHNGKTIALGMDARPTGPSIAEIVIKTFENNGFTVVFSGITAAPEFMAWVKTTSEIDAFAYISASHNPIGHNGFKFGFEDGAVMGGENSKNFISKIIAAAADEESYNKSVKITSLAPSKLPNPEENKKNAETAYTNFSEIVISASDTEKEQADVINTIKKFASKIGIIAELNGSARGSSIDKDFFESFGFKTQFINDTPGNVVHRIVPEGNSLDLCRAELLKAHKRDNSFILGYVPDNDGDRGNVVYFNDNTQTTEILEAQEVFALCVKSELEFLKSVKPGANPAVVVNGPTSMRIERIAENYNAKVFRAEVGEANVVNLASEKRLKGFDVRILGEGSNGGNITYPATVRDPLNTIFALIKLLAFGGFESITEAVNSLPNFSTTSAYEPEAKMQIGQISHANLKENYEKIFPKSFEERKTQLKNDYGITDWKEINLEGTESKIGVGKTFRSGKETGGLKIVLTGEGRDIAFLWMRGSGTEPVFRVMTDIEGHNSSAMQELLSWQRDLVKQAAQMG
ncbi:MAG: hypothetical protein PQJ46_01630 [Spirochaetales bacterium]|nr:hypothetical protein [Spirochaetales bacterium]